MSAFATWADEFEDCDIVNEVSRMASMEGQPAPNPASPEGTRKRNMWEVKMKFEFR